MSKPPDQKPPASEDCVHAVTSKSSQDLGIGHSISPADPQDTLQVSQMERVKSGDLLRVD